MGNHSSGKSSFINYAMGRDVQTAGVAPTDDCFTVITPGPEDSGTCRNEPHCVIVHVYALYINSTICKMRCVEKRMVEG